jgi:LL-diaminopimelate aminotransferase
MKARSAEVARLAARLRKLPPYPFLELNKRKVAALAAGRPVIDFGIGDPDLPTPAAVVAALARAVRDPATHRYPLGAGLIGFRTAAANWYRARFGVRLDPATEVLALIGSKEGIAHFPWAFVNPGESVLVPDPAYPVYRASVVLCGGRPVTMPLSGENGFLPDLEAVARRLRAGLKVRMMFINYPNNPTGAVATGDFFRRVAALAGRYGFIVANDAAYSEVFFDKRSRPESFLSVPGARDVGIEFHSLSKTANMTGWRIGFACGNPRLISGLADLKGNLDSGVFEAVQRAGVVAFRRASSLVRRANRVYRVRRDMLVDGLRVLGLPAPRPTATFYVWVPLPPGKSSVEFSTWLLDRADILVTPGTGFGRYGEGYARFSLTVPTRRVREACLRLERLALALG